MRISKKILAIALSVLMTVSMMPFTAFASAIPQATITEITADGFDKAYKFAANDTAESVDSSSYKNYITDFVVTVENDVAAGAITLGGQYDAYGPDWKTFTLANALGVGDDVIVPAGTKIRLLEVAVAAMGLDAVFTYEDIVKSVKEFNCGVKGINATGVTVDVALNLYESEWDADANNGNGGYVEKDNVEPIKVEDTKYTFGLPKATVTEITADGLEKAYKFKALDDETSIAANEFKNYIADFEISFDKDVVAGGIKLGGQYDGFVAGWKYFTLADALGVSETSVIPAGTKIRLLETAVASMGEDYVFTYEDIVKNVKEFNCGVSGLDAAGVTMEVALNLYESEWDADAYNGHGGYVEKAGAEAKTVTETEYQFFPSATVTEITVEGLDKAYKFTANDDEESVVNSAYKNYITDFVISFDSDVRAGGIKLGGQYDGYGQNWKYFTLAEALGKGDDEIIPAGTPIRLLETAVAAMGEPYVFTYQDIVKYVKEFNCGAADLDASGVKMNVDLNLYESVWDDNANNGNGGYVEKAGAVANTITSASHTFGADEMSITVADKIDLNIYVAKTDDISDVKVTYNTTPEAEANTQTEITYSANELTVEGNYYVVEIPLAPAQIRDNIKVEVLDGADVLRTIETSVAQYCEQIIGGAYNGADKAKVVRLAKATLDYGKAASNYFNYNTAAFANQANILGNCAFGTYNSGSSTDLAIETVSYVATSVPELRFVLADGAITEEAAAATQLNSNIGNAKFAKLPNGKIIIQVTGIEAAKLGKEIVITGAGTIKYTPCRWAQLAASSNDEKLAALGNAIGNYNAASAAYFG